MDWPGFVGVWGLFLFVGGFFGCVANCHKEELLKRFMLSFYALIVGIVMMFVAIAFDFKNFLYWMAS
jgi:hypothetical protein